MPRITGVIDPLNDLSKIPAYILEPKAEAGQVKHGKLEIFMQRPAKERAKYPERSIENLIYGALKHLPKFRKAYCEVECVRGDLTGHPDVYTSTWIGDYKFRIELPDEAALQLIGYEYLLGPKERRLFLFHYPDDRTLVTYEVNPAVKTVLKDFFFELYRSYEDALKDNFVVLDLRYRWAEIVANNDIWLPVAMNLPALSITSLEQAERACMSLNAFSELAERQKYVKSELTRFFQENPDIRSIEAGETKYFLTSRKTAQFKLPPDVVAKIAALKEPYKQEPKLSEFIKKI
jgi:hypothetical protein